MKRSTLKRLEMIRDRVRSLKSSFAVNLRSKDEEERLVPRVAAIVLKEGAWLSDLCERIAAKSGVKLTKNDKQDDELAILAGKEFFGERLETYADDVSRGLFIDRLEVEFIEHMEKLVLLAFRLDSQVKAQVVSIEAEADEDDEPAPAQSEELEEEGAEV